MSASMDNPRNALVIPVLGRLYAALHDGAETVLRVVAGGFFAIHGSQKITNPFGAAEMVEGLGFYPGALWSLLLACTEFFGGIFIAIGFLTRPAAFAGLFVLLVTVWFHWVTMDQGYSGAEKSLLWAAILLFFVIRGGNRHSVDARMGKAF
ncbi:DoxX family protein [Mesorhizobium sp. M7A.T.Ca.TU.009.01.3.2]|uniref:DoxX family protein n=1 Tax=Mesorhizobium sp. M7A.F.Ca.MR.245.00.0.0 TaxID=2496778 RepID=UPI000FCCA49E|nr:DoxX family protein [Mesorhizobium sp. M7A.F.Ca.MR.245.00.0.0]RUU12634.1 DoxX family protein [Mesorhizobium sp. M7A.T.Ca.TU.009.01.3.2]RUV06273.1 DoxX family protein [Mesorhizobium sp. M7A.T.Ca.TU.009.01.3.1]RUV16863.1 DoxX family protein [Mesorhizobium sp. M7A.F.Ca.MR.245.00.0.0]RUV49247.1 DoxX family protein [Mesorhizobium sp. M7A.F.Ca.MR.228.00.0.0]